MEDAAEEAQGRDKEGRGETVGSKVEGEEKEQKWKRPEKKEGNCGGETREERQRKKEGGIGKGKPRKFQLNGLDEYVYHAFVEGADAGNWIEELEFNFQGSLVCQDVVHGVKGQQERDRLSVMAVGD